MIKSIVVQLLVGSPAEVEPSDFDLIEVAKSGDPDAYSQIVKQHQDSIYRMLLRQTGDSETASDLTQETFIRAYEKLSTFRGDSAFSTWLTRISINLANNYFSSRDYKQRKKITGTFSLDHSIPTDSSPIDEKLNLLREFIADLSPKQRSVILLCGLEKKSYEEAAAILKIPVGTVRSRLHEARLNIRNRFLMEASDL